MRFLALGILLFSSASFAHEIQSITQHVDIKGLNKTGWQQDIIGKFNLNRKWDAGIQGTYLERFDFYEKRAGAFLAYKPNERLSLEARYLQGEDNEILPERQTILSAYYALADGYSPYFTYRDSAYSVTRVHTATVGMEIEKIQSVILIPQVLFGKATFTSPNQTRDVYNVGLRAVYYKENRYSFTAFAYTGKEASQGIIGQSTMLVNTLTGGLGAGYNFAPNLKADLIVDHTDYDQLNTQFLTTTLNLIWKF